MYLAMVALVGLSLILSGMVVMYCVVLGLLYLLTSTPLVAVTEVWLLLTQLWWPITSLYLLTLTVTLLFLLILLTLKVTDK
jgi:hypothetical protein